jgi:hypothetical protein
MINLPKWAGKWEAEFPDATKSQRDMAFDLIGGLKDISSINYLLEYGGDARAPCIQRAIEFRRKELVES